MRRGRGPSGAILGIGVDLVEVGRMRRAIDRWGDRLLERVFAPEEQRDCGRRAEPWVHYAARFALKEAVAKAFGTGIGPQLGWRDVRVRRSASGAPVVVLTGRARRLAARRGVARVLASLAHTRGFAVAQAVLLGKESPT